ncbi:Pentatricopeptide repeat [Dillenia turbinata]|uniref:Pentatricopeptide repeat n=1 Tax=Dillenia turbinata TaxID=194707 RepID=A0AAN8VJJ3_9MAGN
MAVVINSVSPISNPSAESARKACQLFSQIPNIHSFSLNKSFSRVLASTQISISPEESNFTLPNWRSSKNDTKTRDVRINDAFLYMEYMVGKGHKPDVAQATQLLFDLCKSNKLRKATRVMEMIVSSGTAPDGASYTFLVNSLCKRGNIGHAMQLVEKMEDRGYPAETTIYNSLVRGLCKQGNLSKGLQLLGKLMQKGLVPNAFTYSFLLEAAYKEKGVNEAIRLLKEIIAKGGKPNLVSYNVLLTGLCKEGRTDEAIKFLEEMPSQGFSPNVVSYNILLRSLCDEGRWEEANKLLSEMEGEERSPSLVTYNILISSLAKHGQTDQALEVLDELLKGRFKPKATSYNPIIARLCKEGKIDVVVKCLDQMMFQHCSPNEGTYNAIAVLCEDGKVREAFSIIQSLGNKQNSSTHDFYKNVISSLCRKGNTYPAVQLLHEMTQFGFTPDSYTYSSLIRGLCLEGMLDEAVEIVKIMEEFGCRPDVDNFNALILGFCKSKRTDLSMEIIEMMIENGYTPNETSYTILVEGIAHEEEMELAAKVLKELFLRHVVSRNTVERLVMQECKFIGSFTLGDFLATNYLTRLAKVLLFNHLAERSAKVDFSLLNGQLEEEGSMRINSYCSIAPNFSPTLNLLLVVKKKFWWILWLRVPCHAHMFDGTRTERLAPFHDLVCLLQGHSYTTKRSLFYIQKSCMTCCYLLNFVVGRFFFRRMSVEKEKVLMANGATNYGSIMNNGRRYGLTFTKDTQSATNKPEKFTKGPHLSILIHFEFSLSKSHPSFYKFMFALVSLCSNAFASWPSPSQVSRCSLNPTFANMHPSYDHPIKTLKVHYRVLLDPWIRMAMTFSEPEVLMWPSMHHKLMLNHFLNGVVSAEGYKTVSESFFKFLKGYVWLGHFIPLSLFPRLMFISFLWGKKCQLMDLEHLKVASKGKSIHLKIIIINVYPPAAPYVTQHFRLLGIQRGRQHLATTKEFSPSATIGDLQIGFELLNPFGYSSIMDGIGAVAAL